MLEFEHIIQINDPQNSRIKPLSRQQLWDGLLLRAIDPGRFNTALSCKVADMSDDGFIRYIQAGNTEFREQVSLFHQERIETVISGDDQPIRAESITSIEEPADGHLFVRFVYRRDLLENRDAVLVGEHLKSAYVQVDIDAIALIRLLADEELQQQRPN